MTYVYCIYVFAAFYGSRSFPGTLVESEKQFYHSATTITCKDFKYPDAVNFTILHSYGHSFTNDSVGLDERHLWFQKYVNVHTCVKNLTPTFIFMTKVIFR